MAHDWANDWMKPPAAVTFDLDGQETTGTVRMVSHDAKQAIVAYEVDGETVEATLKREKLTQVLE